jgi:hypothetical protein
MMPISRPFKEPSLMSTRTAQYVEALIREEDNFDYDQWLKRVRQEEAEANQRSVALNLGQGATKIGNPVKVPHVGRGTAPPMARNLHVPRALRRSGRPLRAKTSKARLRRWLEKVRVAWGQFQGNRARDAVYDYLEAVFAIVLHYKVRRRTKRLLRVAFRFADLQFDKTADPFIAVIRCTCGSGADNKLISKWARALRYVVKGKPSGMTLTEFIKSHGGLNECTRQLASQRKERD